MKKVIVCLLIVISFCAQAQTPAIQKDMAMERRIERQLSRMSLEEKIGQMLELKVNRFSQPAMVNGKPKWRYVDAMKLDESVLDTLFAKYYVGSVLGVSGNYAETRAQWLEWITLIQQKAVKHIGIPVLYGNDHNHGTAFIQEGTLFPQPINMAASFNTALAEEGAHITAYESRASGCPWVFNPTLDLGRDPRWPRLWESFGEDAVVNARMAEAQVRGYQGDNPNHLGPYNVATCIKHYFAYGSPVSGKDRTPVYMAPNILREKYFEPFRAAIQAGALTLMVNSGSVNGVPLHASYEYLTQWVKEDLQWDGMIITDWQDINSLWTREHIAKDKKEAIRIAVNAGVDMTMDPYEVDFCILLKELVLEGKVSQARIDDAVRRILRVKYRLGLFDNPVKANVDYADFGSEKFVNQSFKAAEESMVLLKNEGDILPLKQGTRILVTGPNANQMRCLNGGWSYTWQGADMPGVSENFNTIYEALCNEFGNDKVVLEEGVTYKKGKYFEENEPQIDKVVSVAANVDVIIACVGENSYCETPGNLTDLRLSENQRDLVKALAQTGKPIILILNEGRPRIIADIVPMSKAVVNILLPGNYGGDALAGLLSGKANFSGKLPYTYPSELSSQITYDFKVSEQVKTMEGDYNYDAVVAWQWPFGYGLSYTDFVYSNLVVDTKSFTADDMLTVSVDVKNVGAVTGKEAVLLYSSDLVASITPDNRRLRDFTKVELQPGEQKTITFHLPAQNLAFVGADGRWRIEDGDFVLRVENLIQPIHCTQTKVWDTPNM